MNGMVARILESTSQIQIFIWQRKDSVVAIWCHGTGQKESTDTQKINNLFSTISSKISRFSVN